LPGGIGYEPVHIGGGAKTVLESSVNFGNLNCRDSIGLNPAGGSMKYSLTDLISFHFSRTATICQLSGGKKRKYFATRLSIQEELAR
jgi:hypothetical protein